MDQRIEIQVTAAANKVRLDDFLFDRFSDLSKMYLREVVKREGCEVNGRFENIGYKLRENDLVEITLDVTRETAMRPENIPLDIAFEDEHLLIVNKPPGMLVHPSHRDKSGTLLNGLAYHLNIYSEKAIRPGLIHRLDKETSGLLVVAKTARAHRNLCADFRSKRVEKRYLALVDGLVKDDSGTIEARIGRFPELKYWGVKGDGKHSESRFWVRERFSDSTLIELEPVTGRTNQLRIHCEMIGHPIVGDTKRGGRENERLCLHAYRLGLRHPVSREFQLFENHQFSFPGLQVSPAITLS